MYQYINQKRQTKRLIATSILKFELKNCSLLRQFRTFTLLCKDIKEGPVFLKREHDIKNLVRYILNKF